MKRAPDDGTRVRLGLVILAGILSAAPGALAHEDPPGCFQTGPAIVVTVFRADMSTGVVGSVSECETIFYRASLAKAQDSDTICAFSGGTFKLTTPDGVEHVISNDVPCIGGTGGEGCDAAVDDITSSLIAYTVDPAHIVGGFVVAHGEYAGGVTHDVDGNTPGASATTPKSTPVFLCADNDPCTTDVCDPNVAGPAACSSTPTVCNDNDVCTTDQCNPTTGECEFTEIDCNDNDLCTIDTCDPVTGCANTPVVCNDNDICTDDACDPATGECVFTPDPTNDPSCGGVVHYQCYEIKPFAFARRTVNVEDRYANGPVELRSPNRLCAPSDKRNENPAAAELPGHLAALPTSASSVRVSNQVITNQFGTVTVDLTRRRVLLVPTSKSLVAPPPPLAPPVPDHYQCYNVRRSAGQPRFQPIPGVSAADQFGTHAMDLLRPRYFCAPASKNGENPEAPTHEQGLLCYKARHRVRFGTLSPFINNQFGAEQVRIIRRLEFCVPSTLAADG